MPATAEPTVAEALGAVNTLWREDGRLWGDNTDVAGFLANLDEATPGWDERKEIGHCHRRRGRGSRDHLCSSLAWL